MIGMAGEDSRSAIELLGKHDAGEPVRQGHAPERQLKVGAGQHLRRETFGAADEKSEARGASIAIFADGAGELGAAELFALPVKADQFVGRWHLAEHHHGFGGCALAVRHEVSGSTERLRIFFGTLYEPVKRPSLYGSPASHVQLMDDEVA